MGQKTHRRTIPKPESHESQAFFILFTTLEPALYVFFILFSSLGLPIFLSGGSYFPYCNLYFSCWNPLLSRLETTIFPSGTQDFPSGNFFFPFIFPSGNLYVPFWKPLFSFLETSIFLRFPPVTDVQVSLPLFKRETKACLRFVAIEWRKLI